MKSMDNKPPQKSLELVAHFASPTKGIKIVSGVSRHTHLLEIESLSETIRFQRFFSVVDLHTQSIIFPAGISQWLGYDDNNFSFSFYSSIIHPNHLEAILLLSMSIFELVKNWKVEIAFMKEKYTIDMALRHADGHYVLVRRTLSCWDFDVNTKMPTAYLNEFSILENYEEEYSPGIRPRITDLHNSRIKDFEAFIREKSFDTLEKKKKFSVQELRILRKYAYNQELNSKDIAVAFKITNATVDTHHRRIITKFNNIYPSCMLKSAKEIAQFLRKEYFI
jgi:hypothetical protein